MCKANGDKTMATKTHGRIELDNGHTFFWTLEGKEIYGWVDDTNGIIVNGASGWYRTNDPEKAARLATLALAS